MKRKRIGKCKSRQPPAVGEEGQIKEALSPNAQDDVSLDDYGNHQFSSTTQTETPSMDTKRITISTKAGSMSNKLSRGFLSLSVKPKAKAESTQIDRTSKKNPELTHQVPANDNQEIESGLEVIKKVSHSAHQDHLYNGQELKSALEVIRKVMKMDAAQPFNIPVDPIVLGIPDYFDVIDTPMDFGTICKNLEDGTKYKNSKDVFNDVQYIWNNCSKYNKKGHYILELMERVKKNFTKYWKEAGMFMEQPQKMDGHSLLNSMGPTLRCSTNGQRSSKEHATDHSRYEQQDQMDSSQPPQPHKPPLNYMVYPPMQLQRPCQCHMGSCNQQSPYPHAGSNFGCSGEGSSPCRCSPFGHGSQMGHYAGDPHDWWWHEGRTQSHPHLHQPSIGYANPYPPQHGSHQWLPVADAQSRQHVGPQHLHQLQPSSSFKSLYQPQHKSCQSHKNFLRPRMSQADRTVDLSSSEECLCSPPRADSMIRCRKRGTRVRVGPMKTIDKREDLVTSSQIELPRLPGEIELVPLSSSQPQLSHPQAGSDNEESMIRSSKRDPGCPVGQMNSVDKHQDQVASSQMVHPWPQLSHLQAGTDDGGADSRLVKKKSRGRPRGRNRFMEVLKSTEKIPIAVNEFGQAVGSEAPKLTSFLGIIARDGNISPLNYVDWRALPEENKERMWQDVLSKFDLDPKCKAWVLKSIGKKWKDWKAELKATRFNTHETNEARLADCDERVLPDQWRVLVSFWDSQEAKERSAKNKASRAHQKTGQKNFALVSEEQPQLLDQTAQQPGALQNCSAKSGIFTQVMGHDRHGCVRTYGLGPSPSDLGGPRRAEAETMRMVSNANEEVREMREKMASMEQTCAQMATQMAAMMSMMLEMQKKISDNDGSPSKHLQAVDLSIDSGGLPSSSIQGVTSNQRIAAKSGKTHNASTKD